MISWISAIIGGLQALIAFFRFKKESDHQESIDFVIETEKAFEKIKYGKKEERLQGLRDLERLINE